VDRDRSGAISAYELQAALKQGGWGRDFQLKPVQLMILIFDQDRSGTINLGEFEQLWKYLQSWKVIFMFNIFCVVMVVSNVLMPTTVIEAATLTKLNFKLV
jgi:hypothetical protein